MLWWFGKVLLKAIWIVRPGSVLNCSSHGVRPPCECYFHSWHFKQRAFGHSRATLQYNFHTLQEVSDFVSPFQPKPIGWACKTENFERLYEAGCQQKEALWSRCLSQSVFNVMITYDNGHNSMILGNQSTSNKGTLVVVALQDNQDFGSEPQQDHSWHSEWCTRPIRALGARHGRPGMHLACTTSHIKAWNQNERKWKTIPSKMILLSKIQDFHGCFERRTVLSCCWSLLRPAPP